MTGDWLGFSAIYDNIIIALGWWALQGVDLEEVSLGKKAVRFNKSVMLVDLQE